MVFILRFTRLRNLEIRVSYISWMCKQHGDDDLDLDPFCPGHEYYAHSELPGKQYNLGVLPRADQGRPRSRMKITRMDCHG